MLGSSARKYVSYVTIPIARGLAKMGISANAMTLIGMVCSVSTALFFFPQGMLFAGTMLSWFFVMFDMLDGAIARVTNTTSRSGAVIDASCDRLTDGAIFASLAWWAMYHARQPILVGMLLAIGVFAQVISYIKARAEASGLCADGGWMERTERLIIILVGAGFQGLGVPYALYSAAVVLLLGTVVTIIQRMTNVLRSPLAHKPLPVDAVHAPCSAQHIDTEYKLVQ